MNAGFGLDLSDPVLCDCSEQLGVASVVAVDLCTKRAQFIRCGDVDRERSAEHVPGVPHTDLASEDQRVVLGHATGAVTARPAPREHPLE
jgi:hypothetical protein